MRQYNPVREMILRKLDSYRVGEDGRIEDETHLEALVNVIFQRAVETRGRAPIEAARLLFEYAVGKPNQTIEMNVERVSKARTREEIEAELDEATAALGLPSDFKYALLEEYDGDRALEKAEGRGGDVPAVPVARRRIAGPKGKAEDRDRGEAVREEAPDKEDFF